MPSAVFGKQRPAIDTTAMVVLFAGFAMLAVAVRALTGHWFGVLLPLAYLMGAWAGLRAEIRQVELTDDALLVRTFLRTWPIPREHVTGVVIDEAGAGVDVLNGARYYLTPRGVDAGELGEALIRWWRSAPLTASTRPSS